MQSAGAPRFLMSLMSRRSRAATGSRFWRLKPSGRRPRATPDTSVERGGCRGLPPNVLSAEITRHAGTDIFLGPRRAHRLSCQIGLSGYANPQRLHYWNVAVSRGGLADAELCRALSPAVQP